MACYSPLKAWVDGTTENGKKRLRFAPKRDRPIELQEQLEIPCGQCVGCRLEYSRQWANRCMLELEYHDSAYFVTLTYDDAHVPRSHYFQKDEIDPLTGEYTGTICPSLTLQKRDFQLFMKRLRKKFSNDKIRYFACGEYGGDTMRPHYHAIIYGLHLDDLKVYKKSPQGHIYYNSKSFQSCWSDDDGKPIGYAVLANVTWETCAYTARYIMKKLKGPAAEFYNNFGLQPEFTLMSRKPGIARQYFDDHPDLYEFDFINIKTEKGGRKFKPPRYYDNLYDLEHPNELAEIKEIRKKLAKEAQKAKLENTSLTAEELLRVEERAKQEKITTLRRNLYGS